jgi:hypothetical protein
MNTNDYRVLARLLRGEIIAVPPESPLVTQRLVHFAGINGTACLTPNGILYLRNNQCPEEKERRQ